MYEKKSAWPRLESLVRWKHRIRAPSNAWFPPFAKHTVTICNDRFTSTPAIRLRNRLRSGHTVTLVGGSSRIDAPRGTLRRPRADVLDQSLRPLVPKEAKHATDVNNHAKGRSDAIATGAVEALAC